MSEKRFNNWKFPKFDEEGMTKWKWMCQYNENLDLGFETDIGAFTYINARYKVIIGDRVQIGSHCSIYSNSTIDNKYGKVTILEGARVGSHTVVLPGVTIGKNATVGAASLVTTDIPDNSVAVGTPAKVIKKK